MSKVACPKCGGRFEARGLGTHMTVQHGRPQTKAGRLRRMRTVEAWINRLPSDARTATAVIVAVGELGLRPALRKLYRGEFRAAPAQTQSTEEER